MEAFAATTGYDPVTGLGTPKAAPDASMLCAGPVSLTAPAGAVDGRRDAGQRPRLERLGEGTGGTADRRRAAAGRGVEPRHRDDHRHADGAELVAVPGHGPGDHGDPGPQCPVRLDRVAARRHPRGGTAARDQGRRPRAAARQRVGRQPRADHLPRNGLPPGLGIGPTGTVAGTPSGSGRYRVDFAASASLATPASNLPVVWIVKGPARLRAASDHRAGPPPAAPALQRRHRLRRAVPARHTRWPPRTGLSLPRTGLARRVSLRTDRGPRRRGVAFTAVRSGGAVRIVQRGQPVCHVQVTLGGLHASPAMRRRGARCPTAPPGTADAGGARQRRQAAADAADQRDRQLSGARPPGHREARGRSAPVSGSVPCGCASAPPGARRPARSGGSPARPRSPWPRRARTRGASRRYGPWWRAR